MRVRTIAALTLLACSAGANAGDADGWMKTCKSYESLARTVMDARQTGVEMSKQMDAAAGSKMAQKIIMEAYDHPHYQTEAMKKQAISDFADGIFLDCAKALGPQ